LLQWKLSNNEVFPLNITLFGCLQSWSHQTSVLSGGMLNL